jgi:hypothetical protein
VSALQRTVLFLEVSTPQGPGLDLNVSALQRTVLFLEVSTPQGPGLNLDVSALQRYVLLLEVSTNWGLSCIWTCLIRRDQCLLTVGRVRFASNIIFLLSNVFALLRK